MADVTSRMAGEIKFVAIDVETANSDLSSICQVGIATFGESGLIDEWRSLVNPGVDFGPDPAGHGIKKEDVIDSPTFREVSKIIGRKVNGQVCIAHNASFDKSALEQAAKKDNLEPLNPIWLCSAEVARRTWSDVSEKGYKLKDVCQKIGYEFEHHDALEDAKAAGHVMIAALEESGISLEEWLEQPINSSSRPKGKNIERSGNPNGKLHGEVIVFTGKLRSYEKAEAADLAASLGCDVQLRVTKKTTLLVVKDKDSGKPSRNHQRSKELIAKGERIKVVDEDDFVKLIKDNS